jgi:trehalose synthase
VGGIVIQIQDGVSGYLVTSPEECAARCLDLLRDPVLRKRMADSGREHVRHNFLITRDLRDQLEIVTTSAKAAKELSGT